MVPARSILASPILARPILARLILAFAAALLLTGPLAAQPAPRLLTVLGEARLEAVADRAFVTAGVTTQGKSARDALAANSRTMTDVLRMLREAGLEDADLRTSTVSVQPVVAYPTPKDSERTPRITGYTVANQLTARLADPSKLGELLDKLVSAGANQISDIRFGLADEGKLRDAVRADAVADARRKAELYATAAGARLGRVMALSEVDAPPVPRPLAMRAAAPDAMAVPIAPGEQTVKVQISVTWELDN
ncbi:MAG: SIMPL domain-containing protein [Blastochloris sp.]|nr:SIMPL domain-containing protein [Blastochloris sp.]